jgi:hypothetical protein
MKMSDCLHLITALLVLSTPVLAQDLFVYPADGQDKEQQETDEFQCYSWAKSETGFDPMAAVVPTEPPPASESRKGGVGRGAIRGAAVGAIVDGSDGAKKGAAAGGAIGGIRRRDQQRREAHARQQWEQEQQAQYKENRDRYDRAYVACLEALGYTVR